MNHTIARHTGNSVRAANAGYCIILMQVICNEHFQLAVGFLVVIIGNIPVWNKPPPTSVQTTHGNTITSQKLHNSIKCVELKHEYRV